MYQTATFYDQIEWTVRLIEKGQGYGLDDKLIHTEEEPMVEFFDARHRHTDYGQFVSRYYVSTFMGGSGGLTLYGGVLDWQIDAETRRLIKQWLDMHCDWLHIAPEGVAASVWAQASLADKHRISWEHRPLTARKAG